MNYRREIDGLRALAVLPVILFHAGFQVFGGGFVGVDVFFVISGYLITTIILAEREAGGFSFVKFYERRARRILPALFLVIGVCLPAAWVLLLPFDMREFGQSLVAVSWFCSNVLFWKKSGYFETASELKPLLHTWSLAVEEQYYLLFPLIILAIWRFGKARMVLVLAVLGALSLLAAHSGVVKNPAATFFLLPTRGWELLLGAMAAVLMAQRPVPGGRGFTADVLSACGLMLLLYAVFLFDKDTPFPGLPALVPTLGAALIILYATPQTLVGRMLGSRVLVGIGLVSYSAYLWHQPLFVFARYSIEDQSNPMVFGLLSVVALGLAYLTWRFVEQPFRNAALLGRRFIFMGAAAGSVLLTALGAYIYLQDGMRQRLAQDKLDFLDYFENSAPAWRYREREGIMAAYRFDCDFYDVPAARQGRPTNIPVHAISASCFQADPAASHTVFVWGDSHAQHLNPGLKAWLPAGWQLLQVASSGCAPRLGGMENRADYCQYANWFAYQQIIKAKPSVVLIAQNMDHRADDMKAMAADLKEKGVGKVVFLGPVPHWKFSLPEIIVRMLWHGDAQRSFAGVDEKIFDADRVLKSAFGADGDRDRVYVSAIDYFCNQQGCLTRVGPDRKTDIVSYDYAHFTLPASGKFAQDVLVPVITGGHVGTPQ